MKKSKICNLLLTILIIIAIIVVILIIIKYGRNQINKIEALQVVAQIEESNAKETQNVEEKYIEYKGYKVIGIIEIPKIDIKYPILYKTTDDSLNISVAKFTGGAVNDIGNLTIAGHHYLDGTMFGDINKLELGDKIILEDLYNNTVTYEVFDTYIVDPNDASCVEPVQEGTREVTLITCTNGRKNRLVVKAREI